MGSGLNRLRTDWQLSIYNLDSKLWWNLQEQLCRSIMHKTRRHWSQPRVTISPVLLPQSSSQPFCPGPIPQAPQEEPMQLWRSCQSPEGQQRRQHQGLWWHGTCMQLFVARCAVKGSGCVLVGQATVAFLDTGEALRLSRTLTDSIHFYRLWCRGELYGPEPGRPTATLTSAPTVIMWRICLICLNY